jgi:hypothetical protein
VHHQAKCLQLVSHGTALEQVGGGYMYLQAFGLQSGQQLASEMQKRFRKTGDD